MRFLNRLTAIAMASLMVTGMSATVAFADNYSVTGSSSTTLVTSQSGSSTATKTDTNSTKVYASTTSSGETGSTPSDYGIEYTVVIPQTVHLMKSSKGSGTYTQTFDITSKGDIGLAQTLTVTPDATVMLAGSGYASGAADVDCSVTTTTSGASQSYSRADLTKTKSAADKTVVGTTTNYTATAELTPGDWAGYMDVTITLTTNSN
jgi:hypothetical protein